VARPQVADGGTACVFVGLLTLVLAVSECEMIFSETVDWEMCFGVEF
jgi:hypothetical protein